MAKDEGSPSPVVTREVRAHVVDRVRQPGNTVHSVARELELTETAVREWVKQWQIVSWMTSRPVPDAATVARIRCPDVPAAKSAASPSRLDATQQRNSSPAQALSPLCRSPGNRPATTQPKGSRGGCKLADRARAATSSTPGRRPHQHRGTGDLIDAACCNAAGDPREIRIDGSGAGGDATTDHQSGGLSTVRLRADLSDWPSLRLPPMSGPERRLGIGPRAGGHQPNTSERRPAYVPIWRVACGRCLVLVALRSVATTGWRSGRGQAPVDLGAHDAAVGGRVVVAAQQGTFEVGVGALEAFDLGVERAEAASGDRLPRVDVAGVEHAIDLVEVQAGVLEHADEHKPPDLLVPIAALA